MNRLMSLLAVAVVFAVCATPLLAQPKDEVVFESKLGKVTFKHKGHADRKIECKTCHHKDEAKKEQACKTCHKEKDTADGAPSIKRAVHGKDNKSGTCIACHLKDATKKAPVKCVDCHKK